ncbi:MAG: single-stranded-DNA-specific exonuclease RecJ [Patescibacteria group bacterium]
MEKNWQILPEMDQASKDSFPGMNEVVLQFLFNRGLKEKREMEEFLNPDYDRDSNDPYLFHDMEKAVERILKTKKGKAMIFGDYDADGVCATAILFHTLKSLGMEVEKYIPFRETEGYGLNMKAVEWIIEQKFNLVVTVDCGISNFEEIKTLMDNGIDVVVTDHHEEPPQLPPALAIINPSIRNSGYPFPYLCGAGVAFKLVQAIILKQEKEDYALKFPEGFDKWLLDLVAIATVGDMVSLLGENRMLVQYGLKVMAKTKRLGLQKMIETVNNFSGKIDSQYLGWRIVPRLNAAGRMDHASSAFYLLMADNEKEAEKLVSVLEDNNQKRQQLTDSILKQAEAQADENEKIIFAVGENWPAGVVGLVAGRLSDKYHRPALVIGQEGDKYVGSGRSIEEFNITEALAESKEFLLRYGGHSQACGFTVIGKENLGKFKEKMTFLAQEKLKDSILQSSFRIEAEVNLSQIDFELLTELEKFEPFGEDNPKPLFAALGVRIEQIQTVGADGKHLKVLASQNNKFHKFIGFSFGDWCARLKMDDLIDIIFELDANEWNGNRELQLKIIDLKLSKI